MGVFNLIFSTRGKTPRLPYLLGLSISILLLLLPTFGLTYFDVSSNIAVGSFIVSLLVYLYIGLALISKRIADANYPSGLFILALFPGIDLLLKLILIFPATKNVEMPLPTKVEFNLNHNFYTPTNTKYVVMFLCTLGLYNYYWYYKNFQIMKKSGQENMPFLYALFHNFTAYSLFKFMNEYAKKKHIAAKIPAGILALSIISLALLSQYFVRSFGNAYGLLGILAFIPTLFANHFALKNNYAHSENFVNHNRLSGWNWLAVGAGVCIWVLIIVGCAVG